MAGETGGALKVPAFRLYFVGRSVSSLGDRIAPLSLAFAVLAISGSPSALGIVLAAGTIPKLLLVLVGGVVGDRFERRKVLVSTDLTMGLAQAVSAGLLLTGNAQVWQLAVLQAVYGSASAFYSPTSTGAVRDLVGPELLQQANSLLGITRSAAGIMGPAVAGILVAAAAPGWAIAFDAVTFLVSALALSAIALPMGRASLGNSIRADLVDGWREFVARNWVWVMVLSFTVYQATVLPAVGVVGPVVAEATLGGAGAWAAVLVGRSCGSLLAGGVLLRWTPQRTGIAMQLLMLLDLPFLLGLATGAPLWFVVVSGAFAGGGLTAGDTLWSTALQQHVPDQALARVSSYDWMGSLAMAPVGYALVGGAAKTYGTSSTLYVIAALHVISTGLPLLLPSLRSLRSNPARPEPG